MATKSACVFAAFSSVVLACSDAPLGAEPSVGETESAYVGVGNSLYAAAIGEHIPMNAPEGVYVLGHFDAARPTLVYVHGWVAQPNAVPTFPNTSPCDGTPELPTRRQVAPVAGVSSELGMSHATLRHESMVPVVRTPPHGLRASDS
jgi:hypothetical protein